MRKGINIDDIDTVLIESHKAAVDIIGSEPEKWKPEARETADHSLPYMVAAALMDGELTDRQFEPSRFKDAKLLALVQKVQVRGAEGTDQDMYPEAVGNILHIPPEGRQGGSPSGCRLPEGPREESSERPGVGRQISCALVDPIDGCRTRRTRFPSWVWKLGHEQSDLRGRRRCSETTKIGSSRTTKPRATKAQAVS